MKEYGVQTETDGGKAKDFPHHFLAPSLNRLGSCYFVLLLDDFVSLCLNLQCEPRILFWEINAIMKILPQKLDSNASKLSYNNMYSASA